MIALREVDERARTRFLPGGRAGLHGRPSRRPARPARALFVRMRMRCQLRSSRLTASLVTLLSGSRRCHLPRNMRGVGFGVRSILRYRCVGNSHLSTVWSRPPPLMVVLVITPPRIEPSV